MKLWRIFVGRIFGANTYLRPGISKLGRPYLYLHPEARAFKERVKQELRALKLTLPETKNGLVLIFGIHKDKDVSNMIKLCEDAIAEFLGLNDALWSWTLVFKSVTKEKEEWIAFGFSSQPQPHWDPQWLQDF